MYSSSTLVMMRLCHQSGEFLLQTMFRLDCRKCLVNSETMNIKLCWIFILFYRTFLHKEMALIVVSLLSWYMIISLFVEVQVCKFFLAWVLQN